MTESSSVAVGGRRSREEAERLVREFEQSGMTQTAFCRAQGIALHTLAYYREKHRKPGKPGATHLLPVELVGSLPARDWDLRVELANGRVRPGKHTVDEGCMPRLGYLLSLAA